MRFLLFFAHFAEKGGSCSVAIYNSHRSSIDLAIFMNRLALVTVRDSPILASRFR